MKQRELLEERLEEYTGLTRTDQRVFHELMYTAIETGLLDISMSEDDADTLYRLFQFALEVRAIPKDLRM